jgi:inhibitor of cysteine peptidase
MLCDRLCEGIAMAINLTDKDDGGRIRAKVGDTIEIRLPENATAGYRWSVDHADDAVFEASHVGAEYPDEAVGSGGHALVRVKVHSPGNGTVRLKYGRPWEGADDTQKHFSVDVDARPH